MAYNEDAFRFLEERKLFESERYVGHQIQNMKALQGSKF